MKKQEFDKIMNHYKKFFWDGDEKNLIVFHEETEIGDIHIDIAHFRSTNKFPYQVLATIGASDYKMPQKFGNLSNYFEYLVFLDKNFDINNHNNWIINFLFYIAKYAFQNKTALSYCHTIDLPPQIENQDSNMNSCYLMFPEASEPSILRLKTGIFKTVTFLQAMPITGNELEDNFQNGPEYLRNKFYNEKENNEEFLAKIKR